VNALCALTNDTTPPPESSLLLTQDDPYVTADLCADGGTLPTNWGTVDTYVRGSTGIHAVVAPNPNKYLDFFSRSLVFSDVPHVFLSSAKLPTTALDICLSLAASKAYILFAERGRQTNQAELLALFYDQINVATASLLVVPYHGVVSEPDPLKGYEQYQTANWDGHDAEPITAETLAYARKLMRVMPKSLGAPDAAPAGDGSIALEWVPESSTHKLDRLFLDIGPGEVWRAYWTLKTGEFDRVPHTGFSPETKVILKNLFDKLSA
jgi:hypothetical protein